MAIDRDLAMDPRVMLFDAPTAALRASSAEKVRTVIIVSHDGVFARDLSNPVLTCTRARSQTPATRLSCWPGSARLRANLANSLN